MVEPQPSKLVMRVRFSSPALRAPRPDASLRRLTCRRIDGPTPPPLTPSQTRDGLPEPRRDRLVTPLGTRALRISVWLVLAGVSRWKLHQRLARHAGHHP